MTENMTGALCTIVNELPETGDAEYMYIVPVPETDIYEIFRWIDGDYVLVSESCDYQMAKKKWDYLLDEHYLAIKEITDSGKEWTVEIKAVDEEETRPKKVCTMGFQGVWCNECTQYWNCDILSGIADTQVIEEE